MVPKKKDDKPAKDDQLQQLIAERDAFKELAARAQADLQNAKGRMEKERSDTRRFAEVGLLAKLLPTIDNLQRAFAHLPDDLKDHEWVKGVQAVEAELMKELESVGLKKIDSLGQAVDPEKHEVLQAGPGKEGKITEVFEEGYELSGKVLRPAKVKVGSGE